MKGAAILIPETALDWEKIAIGLDAATGAGLDAARSVVRRLAAAAPATASVAAVDARGAVIGHIAARVHLRTVDGRAVAVGVLEAAFVNPDYRIGANGSLLHDLMREFRERFEATGRLAAVFAWFEDSDWWHLKRSQGFEAMATGLHFVRPKGARVPLAAGTSRHRVRVLAQAEPIAAPLPCRCGDTPASIGAGAHVRLGLFDQDDPIGEAAVRDHGDHLFLIDWRAPPGDFEAAAVLLDAVVGDAAKPVHFRVWNPTERMLYALERSGFATTVGGPEPILAFRTSLPSPRRRALCQADYLTSGFIGEAPLPLLAPPEHHLYRPYFND